MKLLNSGIKRTIYNKRITMSRDEIIKTIRQNIPLFKPLPEGLDSRKILPGELEQVFKQSLKQVGAGLVMLNGGNELIPFIKEHYEEALDFDKPEIRAGYPSNCSHEKMDKIDIALLSGQFGVAENGAIWLDETNFPNRMIPFVAQQLIIRLPLKNLVPDMQEAYRRVNIKESGFGIFISGPSKTADIEQELVYGAHGSKKLIVITF
jgi:L-lactate dehydrogenase complex protein LldG